MSAFDTAIDVIEEALRACPDARWEDSLWHVPRTDPWVWPAPGVEPVPERTDGSIQRFSAFWCVAYHALWFLALYATPAGAPFESAPAARGGPEELPFPAADGAVSVPDRVWPRDALLEMAAHGRRTVHATLAAVTPEQLATKFGGDHPRAGETFEAVLHVNLEHLREHGAQMEAFIAASS